MNLRHERPSGLPESLKVESSGAVALLRISRPQKRNALDNETIAGIEQFFADLPPETRAVVVHGEGKHFAEDEKLSRYSDYHPLPEATERKHWGAERGEY